MMFRFRSTPARILLLIVLLPILAAGFAWSRWQPPQCLRVAFSADGKRLATISVGKWGELTELQIWDVTAGRELLRIEQPNRTIPVAFSHDGTLVATGSRNGAVKWWNVATGQLKRSEKHSATVTDLCFSPDGKTLAVAIHDGTVKFYDADAPGDSTEVVYGSSASDVQFSPDGSLLAIAGYSQPIQIWTVADGKPESLSLTLPQGYGSIAFAPDGKTLASFDIATRLITQWDIETGKSVASIPPRISDSQFAISSDAQLIATCGHADGCRIWDVAAGRPVAVLDGHNRYVWSIAFSPRDRTLATSGEDGAVRLWDLTTGKPRILLHHYRLFPWLTAALIVAFLIWSVLWVQSRLPWKWQAPCDLALLASMLMTVIILRLVTTGDRRDPTRPAFLLLWTFLGSLLSLVLFWVSFGRTRWSLRLPGFFAGAALVCVWPLVIWRDESEIAWELIIGGLALVGISLAAGRILRLAGFRLAHAAARDLPQPPGKQSEHQIFLMDLILWTAAIAVLCAVARLAQPEAMRTSYIVFLVGAGTFLSVSGVVAAWAVLGTGSVLWRWLVLVCAIAVCVAGHFLLLTLVPRGGPRGQFLVSPLVVAGFVGAALWIFRVHGFYRLCRADKAD